MAINILILCKKVPYPEKDGESIAIMNAVRSLNQQDCVCHLIALNTNKHYINPLIAEKELNKSFKTVRLVDHDSSINKVQALSNYLTNRPYVTQRFYNKTFEHELLDFLSKTPVDIVQLETIFLSPYLGIIKDGLTKHLNKLNAIHQTKIVLRAHNIESEIWSRLAERESNYFKKNYLNHTSKMLAKSEMELCQKLDAIITLSPKDYSWFENATNSIANPDMAPELYNYPIGVNLSDYPVKSLADTKPFKVCFIGAMDWRPNINGIRWFLDKVWPTLSKTYNDIELYIAGRNMSTAFKSQTIDGVKILGEVEDAISFMAQADVMVVPLFEASGMRVKIIEAMALGIPVISSSIGKEGNHAAANTEILIADTADAFIEQITQLYNNFDMRRDLSINGRKFIEDNFDITRLSQDLYEHYKSLIE